MTKKAFRRSLSAVTLLLATVAVMWALRPTPTAVETTIATRGPLTATVIAEGRARVKDLYVVAAPVDGDLERISVEPGDAIRPGTPVARIWPITPRPLDARSRAEADAAVAAARAAVTVAEATEKEAAGALVHAESQLATTRALVSGSAAARNELEHAGHEADIRREALEAARAAVGAARAELRRAEAVVATTANRPGRSATIVSSPVTGRVLRVLRESAGPLGAGTSLIEIGDTTLVEVVADFLTADAMKVRPGAAGTIRDWGDTTPIAARVRRVDPAAFTKVSALGLEEQRVPVVLDLVGTPPAGLGHDFRVTVSIAVWEGKDVLAVQSTALFRSADHWEVFAIRDGRARAVPVTPGPSDETRTAIEKGLTNGDVVVIQPSDLLSDGVRVAEIRRAP